MSADGNKATLLRYVDVVWGRKNLDALGDFLVSSYRRHVSHNAPPLDVNGQRQRLVVMCTAFPDAELTVEAVLADGDLVAFRSTMRGTHRAALGGVKATGRPVAVGLVDMVRFEDGKIAEHWGGADFLDLYGQIGAVLTDGPHPSHTSWKTLE